MIDSQSTSIIDLIFNQEFKIWLKKGQPNCNDFSNLTKSTLEEAIDIIATLESSKKSFSKLEINEKYTDLMTIIKSEK